MARLLAWGGEVFELDADVFDLIPVGGGEVDGGDFAEFAAWYLEQFLMGGGKGRGEGATVANHLMRAWGHRHLYDFGSLEACLQEAGFTEVRKVGVGEAEWSGRLPEGFYAKERLVVEATPLRCPKCQTTVTAGALFCMTCEATLAPKYPFEE